jgi:ABC-type amino acid transport substrate-binding protein
MNERQRSRPFLLGSISTWIVLLTFALASSAWADLKEVKERGGLKHLGVVYANFITGSGDGLDVEVMKLFADSLGVGYEFVETTWGGAIGDLTGRKVVPQGDEVELGEAVPVRGDVIATGFTILKWRQKVVDYSIPCFPTQIWLVTGTSSNLKPVAPSGNEENDIAEVKRMLSGCSILGVPDTCLDPNLYGVNESGASAVAFTQNLNALVPAVINGEAETTLLEVPDALSALQKWPGRIKVIGPLSPMQYMATAFDKRSPELRAEFNRFFEGIMKDGTYEKLVRKYYPLVFDYYPEFFKRTSN